MLILGHIGLSILLVYALERPVDYRYVIIGSLLSDIIDKPLGNIVFYGVLNNGRIIGHTIAFALLLTAAGLFKKKVLCLAYGVWMHFVLDMMWLNPVTLLWPLLGNFQKTDFSFFDIINQAGPYNTAGEIFGFGVLVFLVLKHRLYITKNLLSFMASGNLKGL
jgi:membrane-bound metal-dependent hydrolase YbcI (DUF457 family)